MSTKYCIFQGLTTCIFNSTFASKYLELAVLNYNVDILTLHVFIAEIRYFRTLQLCWMCGEDMDSLHEDLEA